VQLWKCLAVARKVQKLVERLRNAAPWIEGTDLPTARSWAELEIIGASVFCELAEHGALNNDDLSPRAITKGKMAWNWT